MILHNSEIIEIKAYCPCKLCTGPFNDGVTATGKNASFPGIAADPKKIPYGTMIYIPNVGLFEVDDTGSALRNSDELNIELRFKTHQEALEWGVQKRKIIIFRRK